MNCDDYCCNYGCNQGRNCPARVAPIKSRMHGPEPLPPSNIDRYLLPIARWMLLVIAVLLAATSTIAFTS